MESGTVSIPTYSENMTVVLIYSAMFLRGPRLSPCCEQTWYEFNLGQFLDTYSYT